MRRFITSLLRWLRANLRYDWFETVRKECGANVIAVAHHQDDSAETILLNLIRGTGIHGLCGIRPRNGYIIRPLLCVSRQEILDYLHSLNQTYVTDSTNLQDEYTRNKIRLRLLPLMEEINPSVKESLQKTGFYLSEVDKVYGKVIEEGKKRVMQGDEILISALLKEPSPFALLFEILHPKGFNSSQIMEIYQAVDGQSGKVFTTPDYRVVKDRDRFIVQPMSAEDNKPPFELTYHDNDYTPDFVIPRESRFACLDRDKLPGKLVLRKWKEGDSFVPFGMKGRKLVSDFLTDLKLSVIQKEQQWLLCSDEQIVWVVGKRIDNRFRVDGSTKKIVLVEMIEKKII
jgi:tRNA(Ile)-lysidine synthase